MSAILNNLLAAYEKDKNNAFLQYGIAIEYRNSGQMDMALSFFNAVYEKFPEYVPNYYHFAQALEGAGETERAKAICQEGLKVAQAAGNAHAAAELQQALQDLLTE